MTFFILIAYSGYNISHIHYERIPVMCQIKLLAYKKVASSVQKAKQQLEIKVNTNTPWPKAIRNLKKPTKYNTTKKNPCHFT